MNLTESEIGYIISLLNSDIDKNKDIINKLSSPTVHTFEGNPIITTSKIKPTPYGDKAIAPWPDYDGNEIVEGDTVVNPSGQSGTVVYMQNYLELEDQWLVDYGDEMYSRLCLQIGDKGMAVVKNEN